MVHDLTLSHTKMSQCFLDVSCDFVDRLPPAKSNNCRLTRLPHRQSLDQKRRAAHLTKRLLW